MKMAAITDMVERQLVPAVHWFLWGEDAVFVKFTKPSYCTDLGRVRSLYLPHRWRRGMTEQARTSQLSHCFRSLSDVEMGCEVRQVFVHLLLA